MKRFALLVLAIWSMDLAAALALTWSEMLTPAVGAPRAVGSYAAGCIQGAVPLPPEGPGFQTMRRSRHRFFGHPVLIRYLQELGATTAQQGLGVLSIGDLGQPRGGPMPTGHRSHQNGLDADVWFWLPPGRMVLKAAEPESMEAPTMLAPDGRGLNERQWSDRQADVLRLAARLDPVARIFVNPVIKRALCEQFPGAAWLHKLRPWWGHDDHFHVRLRCPAGETACQDQDPLLAGDGCGTELAWWFSEEARQPPPRVDIPKIRLPGACDAMLQQ